MNDPSFQRLFLASFFGITSSLLLVWPVDVVKYNMQMNMRNTFINTIINIYKSNGLLGFYTGFNASFLQCVPKETLNFTLYPKLREIIEKQNLCENRNVKNAITSILVACTGTIFLTPFQNWAVRSIYESNSNGKINPLQYLLKNPKKLYSGMPLILSKDISRNLIRFCTYDFLYREMKKRYEMNNISIGALTGGTTNAIVSFTNNPIDVVLTHRMTNYKKDRSIKEICKNIYVNYGLKGFYRGSLLRGIRGSYGGVIWFSVYEAVKNI